MKKALKIIAVVCVVALCATIFPTVSVAVQEGVDYKIVNNPYDDVDWTNKQFKADLHSHTTASDGHNSHKEMIEKNYGYGFDIYAISDHGTTDYSWTDPQVVPALKVILQLRDPEAKLEPLEPGGSTADGDQYVVVTENGDDYYYQIKNGQAGHKMLRVPFANENNPTSLNNAHVNGFFVDYGHGILGGTSDYETPIKNIHELGGVSVINHPGEYTGARDEDTCETAYDSSFSYYINKFESLLKKYDSCIGIDINSKGDTRTRYDRQLWDKMLEDLAPLGRNVLAVATSDAHSVGAAYTGYTRMLMPELTSAELKKAMLSGNFFPASRCIGNHNELKEIADYLIANGDSEAAAIGEDILSRQEADYDAKYIADYTTDAPFITRIDFDDDADVFEITTSEDLCIRWISNGKTIGYGKSIDLDKCEGEVGRYIRAEVFGKGGVTYTQPILIDYTGSNEEGNNKPFVDFWWVASFIPDTLVRFLGELDIFKFLWEEMR